MVTFSVTQDPSSESLACDAILQAHDSRQGTRQAMEGQGARAWSRRVLGMVGWVAVETITWRGALGRECRSELPEEPGGVDRTWAPARYKGRQRT